MTKDLEAFEFKLAMGSLSIEMTAAELEEFIVAAMPIWGPIVDRRIQAAIREALAARLGRLAAENE